MMMMFFGCLAVEARLDTNTLEDEIEFALGTGLCGRIVGEYLDSLATLNIPSWGYGLRYEYGLFEQEMGE